MEFVPVFPVALGNPPGIYGEVFRTEKDRRGNPVTETFSEDGHIGTIGPLIMGGQSSSLRDGRQETADTTGKIGVPRDGIKLKMGDRVVILDVRYSVVGPREFDYPSNLTGTDFGLYWVEVRAVV